MTIAIIVHGGAWDIPAEEHVAHKAGCRTAAVAGYQILAQGGSALEAVEAAVTILEDAPAFDAGIGSHLNRAGRVQLDAGIMDGETLQVGALAAVERLQNPIQVARLLLNSKHNLLVGSGAEAWAVQQGVTLIDPTKLIVPREQTRYEAYQQHKRAQSTRKQPDGTVGAVALDQAGNLVAGTSTGGTMFKPVGRVGDSPLPGCGYYADNRSAAVSSTGHGESIIRVMLARTAADFARQLTGPHSAAETAVRLLHERVDGLGGLIMIDRQGQIGFAYNTPHLARAYLAEGMTEPIVAI